MSDLVIACMSQKGGVGKSTVARLIARTYAAAGWDVKICDFNVRQLTSLDWNRMRLANEIKPEIACEPVTSTKKFKTDPADLLVVDGAPDSNLSSLEAARIANLIVIPTGASVDDIKPQLGFANELAAKGIPRGKMLFVFQRIIESKSVLGDAAQIIRSAGYAVAEAFITTQKGYVNALNNGRALSETNIRSLDERADALAAEIVDKVNIESGVSA